MKTLVVVLAAILLINSNNLVVIASSLNISDKSCQDSIEDWLWNLRPNLDPDNATLTVDWGPLDRRLSEAGCSYDKLWLELWRLSHDDAVLRSRRMKWTKKNVVQFERCNRLSPEFEHHATREHTGKKGSSDDDDTSSDTSWFPHVVEKEYVLRLCPCGGGGGRVTTKYNSEEEGGGGGRTCNCEYKESRVFCSDLLSFPATTISTSSVFEYCLGGPGPSPSSSVEAPQHTGCDAVTLSGEVPSCTAIQSYDRVTVTLHPVADHTERCTADLMRDDGNGATTNVVRYADLARVNATHGRFSVDVDHMGGGGEGGTNTYCLKMDLLEHPYCQQQHVDVADHRRRPSVCSTIVGKPVRTLRECSNEDDNIPLLSTSSSSFGATLGWTLGVSAVGFGLLVIIILYCARRHQLSRVPKLIIPQCRAGSVKGGTEMAVISGKSNLAGDIFFLHFPESEEFDDLNARLGEWLGALGARVHDLSDEGRSEEILSELEEWAEAKIRDPKTRIVLVNSPMAAAEAAGREDRLKEEDKTGGEGTPLMAAAADNLRDLRINALRHVQAQCVGNYKRLCVVTFSSCSGQLRPPKDSKNNSTALTDLTAQARWVLPENLEAVREWVTGSGVVVNEEDEKVLARDEELRGAIARYAEGLRREAVV